MPFGLHEGRARTTCAKLAATSNCRLSKLYACGPLENQHILAQLLRTSRNTKLQNIEVSGRGAWGSLAQAAGLWMWETYLRWLCRVKLGIFVRKCRKPIFSFVVRVGAKHLWGFCQLVQLHISGLSSARCAMFSAASDVSSVISTILPLPLCIACTARRDALLDSFFSFVPVAKARGFGTANKPKMLSQQF